MHPLITTLQLLGRALYERPSADNRSLYLDLAQLPQLLDWPEPEQISALVTRLPELEINEHEFQFSLLFEGQGHLSCPPWGSVYLDANNIVFGPSTLAYQRFLGQCGLGLTRPGREPEDQFGLMLLALSQLLVDDQHAESITLLEQHLLPWCFRYLALLAANEHSLYYANLAQICQQLLTSLQQEFAITPAPAELFF